MQAFYEKLDEYYEQKPSKKPFNKEQMKRVIEEILVAKKKRKMKTRREYFLLNTYDVIETADGETKYLVKKRNESADFVFLVSYEEIYEKLFEIHIATGHGSRDKMLHTLGNKFQITRPCIEIFLTFCETCHKRKSKMSSRIVVPSLAAPLNVSGPIINDFMYSVQVDLIDFQSIPDQDFKWMLNFQDHATKFLCLRPLKTNTTKEVARELLQIFLTFGAPQILHSDNGMEFNNSVIQELKILWPQLNLINGWPRPPGGQNSTERSNQDLENMVRAWMIDNNSASWALGCNFIQWQENCSEHRIIGRTPYNAVFGGLSKFGLEFTNHQSQITPSIKTEVDLEDGFSSKQQDDNVDNTYREIFTNNYAADEVIKITREKENTEFTESPMKEDISQTSEDVSQCNDLIHSDDKESTNTNALVCTACSKENSATNKCSKCNKAMHVTDGQSADSEEFETTITCKLCSTEKSVKLDRKERLSGLKRAAEELITNTKKRLSDVQISDCVLFSMNKVDKTTTDRPNILCIITDV